MQSNSLLIGFDEVGRGCIAGPVCTGAYSCSSFYENPDRLLTEVKRSRELISSQFLNLDSKDIYNSSTLVNELDLEESYQELNDLSNLLLLEDSKKVPHHKRENLCKALLDVPNAAEDFHILYATNFQAASKIDTDGIISCIWQSMAENLVSIVVDYINIKNKYPDEIILMIDGVKTIANLCQRLDNIIQTRGIKDVNFYEEDLNPKQQNFNLREDYIKIKQISIIKGDSKSSLIAAASNIAKLTRDQYMQSLEDQHGYGWNKNVGYGTKKHLETILKLGITSEHRKSFLGNLLTNTHTG